MIARNGHNLPIAINSGIMIRIARIVLIVFHRTQRASNFDRV